MSSRQYVWHMLLPPTTTHHHHPDTRQFFVAPHEKKLYSDRNIFKGHCMIYGFVFN